MKNVTMKRSRLVLISCVLVLLLAFFHGGLQFSRVNSAEASFPSGPVSAGQKVAEPNLYSQMPPQTLASPDSSDEGDSSDGELSTAGTVWGLLSILILVGLNGFFVAAEFSLVSVRHTRIEELISKGNRAAVVVGRAVADPDRFIAATQLGITLASLGLGWIGEPALVSILMPLLSSLPEAWIGAAAHSIAGTIAFAFITFMHVVVGELAPKSIALQKPENTALLIARPTEWTLHLFRPAIWLLNGTGNAMLRLFGFQPASGHEMVHSVAELRMLVEASHEGGVLATDEREMLDAVFDFGRSAARQVMVPRTEMICLPATASLDKVAQLAAEHALTKFPIYEGDLDHIIGIVHTKDLVRVMYAQGQEATSVRGIVRPALFLPESIRIDDLLVEFRRRKQHIAILLDEYGGTAGLVTLEDPMEEIVGDVQDVFDGEDPEIQRLPDGSVLLSGLMQIKEVKQEFDLDLSDPHYDTIAGYMLGRLGRLARVGDEVKAGGVRLRVEALDRRRIARLSIFFGVNEQTSKEQE
jgi:CBS domain containing-hemolysin-like protein